jgi:hypothetical protein
MNKFRPLRPKRRAYGAEATVTLSDEMCGEKGEKLLAGVSMTAGALSVGLNAGAGALIGLIFGNASRGALIGAAYGTFRGYQGYEAAKKSLREKCDAQQMGAK